MRIVNYLSSLLPTFGKEQITEDCRITRAEIKDITQPSYDNAVPLLKSWKFKSSRIQEFNATFNRMVKHKESNLVTAIAKAFPEILENLETVEDMITKSYSEDVATGALTYLKANLLQFTECVGFVSKYARQLLIYIYICETEVFPDGGTVLKDSLSKAEQAWLNNNFVSFCTAFAAVSGASANVRKALDTIPEIVVTSENASTLPATVGETKLDPFQMRLIPIWMNPIYHVGMFVAEWQANRYKAAKEEVKLIELRKLNLVQLSEGKPDAHVQKQITYMESRVQGLNYKIAQMEKKHA